MASKTNMEKARFLGLPVREVEEVARKRFLEASEAEPVKPHKKAEKAEPKAEKSDKADEKDEKSKAKEEPKFGFLSSSKAEAKDEPKTSRKAKD